jgi:threonyl-tRNA synthetase
MINITLPDGSKREYPGPVSVAEVAASIGTGLAKAALAGKINGKVVDTSFVIEQDAAVHHHRQGCRRPGSDPPLHRPLAGLCRQGAVPDAGHHRPGDRKRLLLRLLVQAPFTPEDLAAIEKKMTELANKDEQVVRRVLPRDEVAVLQGHRRAYKAEIIASIPATRM